MDYKDSTYAARKMNQALSEGGGLIVNKLQEYRTEWLDEIPDYVAHGGNGEKDLKTKARLEWWTGVMGYLDLVVSEGLVSPALSEEIDEFLKKYVNVVDYKDNKEKQSLEERTQNVKGHPQKMTKEEEIQEANQLIDKVLHSILTPDLARE